MKLNQSICPPGYTYRVRRRKEGRCRKCYVCPQAYTVANACTPTSDTTCVPCVDGTFNLRRGRACRNCTVCAPGSYQYDRCWPYRNTQCRPCRTGTFSAQHGATQCWKCSQCREGKKELLSCTATSDTMCEGFEYGRCICRHDVIA